MKELCMKNVLELYSNRNELVSICADKEDQDTFSVGYIKDLSNELFVIDSYDSDGCRDGIKVRKISDVIVIESGGSYEKKIQNSIESVDDLNTGKVLFIPSIENFHALLRGLSAKKILVEIYYGLPEYKYVGIISEIDAHLVRIEKKDEFGENDGVGYLLIDKIQGLDYVSFI